MAASNAAWLKLFPLTIASLTSWNAYKFQADEDVLIEFCDLIAIYD